ncbi:reverse transcriptase [Phytophthora palmivora]|uniref:Reverse transcriptase n=1 Tax=Phytophthora palmivora TaxID=4796 RepID=A0A2P4XA71_9STRA|nr:reverse transcriptase [Phytophthora palmivora]
MGYDNPKYNAVHASTGFTPFYLNGLRQPQVQCGTRINGVYPVLIEWATIPPCAAHLAGWNRCLHPRVFKKTIAVIYRRQADANQPG